MTNILPVDTAIIEDLKTEMVLSLELQRDEGCDVEAIGRGAAAIAAAIAPLVAETNDADSSDFESTFPVLESVYGEWKAIAAAFRDTLNLAYAGTIPASNLQLDSVFARMREHVGDPLAARYTSVRRSWRRHVADRPWDTYINRAPAHLDSARLELSLAALVRGDDLDVDDAIGELTGDLRHAFADYLEAHPQSLREFEFGLWKRPELIVANDYWVRGREVRLVDVLAREGTPRFSDAIKTIDRLLTSSNRGGASVVEDLKTVPEAWRERVNRCLLLHPDHEVRRYAANNADINTIWKVLSPAAVPCATILSLLEHMGGSSQYTVSQRKVFFDTVYRRLLSVATRADVLYARGIARILIRLDFFLEDAYFSRLMRLLDYLAEKERSYRFEDGLISKYVERLRAEKSRVGSVPTPEPDFDGIPLVILRKLARDGHFWLLLSMHPIVKIARETVPHVNTPDRAFQLAGNHRANPEVIRAVGKQRQLFARHSSRIALLSNPRTPPGVSLEYLSELTRADMETLLRRSGLHPETRSILRQRFTGTR